MSRSSSRASSAIAVLALAILVAASPASADPRPIGGDRSGGIPEGGLLFIPEIQCDAFGSRVFHMDKISFTTIPTATIICPAGTIDPPNAAPFFINVASTMDIKVLDDPALVADVRQKVADFLNALGCLNGAGVAVLASQIDVLDVEYATACGKELPPGD